MTEAARKYPRTPHLEGSKLQPGDTADGQLTLAALREAFPDCRFISEEKIDGANAGIFFNEELDLCLQSRGHVLSGGAREAQFNLMKDWTTYHEATLLEVLEDRYTMYGEWTFARHTQFYDRLPHFFLEFDILDRLTGQFLSTPARRALLDGSPIVSVPVVSEEWPANRKAMHGLVQPSLYRSDDWRDNLALAAERAGVDPDQALSESGDGTLGEGIYVKIETAEETVGRFKFVQPGFLQTILESGTHWSARPMIRNQLASGVDIMSAPARDVALSL